MGSENVDEFARLMAGFTDEIKRTVQETTQAMEIRLERQIEKNANISLENHEETRKALTGVKGDLREVKGTVDILWKKVHGPNVPPPRGSGEMQAVREGLSKEEPLTKKVSQHDLDLAKTEGLIIGLSSTVNQLSESMDARVSEVHAKMDEVLTINRKQSEAIGVDVSIWRDVRDFLRWAWKTKDGQRFVMTGFAAITSLVTAIGTTYALVSGRLPIPTSPISTPAAPTPGTGLALPPYGVAPSPPSH